MRRCAPGMLAVATKTKGDYVVCPRAERVRGRSRAEACRIPTQRPGGLREYFYEEICRYTTVSLNNNSHTTERPRPLLLSPAARARKPQHCVHSLTSHCGVTRRGTRRLARRTVHDAEKRDAPAVRRSPDRCKVEIRESGWTPGHPASRAHLLQHDATTSTARDAHEVSHMHLARALAALHAGFQPSRCFKKTEQ